LCFHFRVDIGRGRVLFGSGGKKTLLPPFGKKGSHGDKWEREVYYFLTLVKVLVMAHVGPENQQVEAPFKKRLMPILLKKNLHGWERRRRLIYWRGGSS